MGRGRSFQAPLARTTALKPQSSTSLTEIDVPANLRIGDEVHTLAAQLLTDRVVFLVAQVHVPAGQAVLDLAEGTGVLFEDHDGCASVGQARGRPRLPRWRPRSPRRRGFQRVPAWERSVHRSHGASFAKRGTMLRGRGLVLRHWRGSEVLWPCGSPRLSDAGP